MPGERALKWAAGLLGGAVVLAVGGIIALTYALDAGALTPRIVAAIEAATGRAATLGRVSIGLGLTPRVTIEEATLANLPGGSRPDMARIRHIEANLALLPLLSGDIAFRQIAIEGADILLEQRPDGTPNWVFQPAARDAGAGLAPPRPAGRRTPAPAHRHRRRSPSPTAASRCPTRAWAPSRSRRRGCRGSAAAAPRPSRRGSGCMASPSR